MVSRVCWYPECVAPFINCMKLLTPVYKARLINECMRIGWYTGTDACIPWLLHGLIATCMHGLIAYMG